MISHDTAIILDVNQNDNDFDTAKLLQQEIKKVLALSLLIKKKLSHADCEEKNCISFEYDATGIGDEAYRLIVTPKKITISAGSGRGFLYGASTLIQLCKIHHGEIKCVEIDDKPSFKNRGYMLDVSRGRVPTMFSLKDLVDKLSLYKINQLQLYMENCLRLDGFEEIWSQTDPFLPEEILELDQYCESRGVELVPCVATFGHLYDLLRSICFGKYREIDERGEIFTWRNRLRYHTINISDPGSLTLITGILEQYIPLFRSRKFNICCDETYDLGKGKSAPLAKETSIGDLYVDYVNKLVEFLQNKGKEVMIWGDVLQKNTDVIDKINPQVTCLNWHYGYGAKEQFAKICHENHLTSMFVPAFRVTADL
jgi:N-acetyl-beta-hexosaminidase